MGQLVLSRSEQQVIEIGAPGKALIALTAAELAALSLLAAADPSLADLAGKLDRAQPGTLDIKVVDIRLPTPPEPRKVRLAFYAPNGLPVHRAEIPPEAKLHLNQRREVTAGVGR